MYLPYSLFIMHHNSVVIKQPQVSQAFSYWWVFRLLSAFCHNKYPLAYFCKYFLGINISGNNRSKMICKHHLLIFTNCPPKRWHLFLFPPRGKCLPTSCFINDVIFTSLIREKLGISLIWFSAYFMASFSPNNVMQSQFSVFWYSFCLDVMMYFLSFLVWFIFYI